MNLNTLSRNQKLAYELLNQHSMLTVSDYVKYLHAIPRPTIKQILQALETKGLIEQHGHGRGAFYVIKDEESILDAKAHKITTVYRSLAAFGRMFDKIAAELKPGDKYWALAFKAQYHDTRVTDILYSFHKRLADKKVEDLAIGHTSTAAKMRMLYKDNPNLKLKFTSENLPIGVIILKDSIIQLIWSPEPLAVRTYSKEMHSSYAEYFKEQWRKAK
jgi:hypothetical protein